VNWISALERWKENGQAPDRIDAARVAEGRLEMSRPLCPYPQVARYTGTGSTNEPANFVCKAP
jgi:feruloyl esterase